MVSNRLLLALVALAISPVFTAPIPDDDTLVVRDEDGSEAIHWVAKRGKGGSRPPSPRPDTPTRKHHRRGDNPFVPKPRPTGDRVQVLKSHHHKRYSAGGKSGTRPVPHPPVPTKPAPRPKKHHRRSKNSPYDPQPRPGPGPRVFKPHHHKRQRPHDGGKPGPRPIKPHHHKRSPASTGGKGGKGGGGGGKGGKGGGGGKKCPRSPGNCDM